MGDSPVSLLLVIFVSMIIGWLLPFGLNIYWGNTYSMAFQDFLIHVVGQQLLAAYVGETRRVKF